MTGFTLDDVRDSFVADMTRCLGQIDASTREVEEAVVGADQLVQATQHHAELIGITLHAITGTTSLLSIESMLGASRALESLGPAAGESLRMLALHVGHLRAIAASWVEGGR